MQVLYYIDEAGPKTRNLVRAEVVALRDLGIREKEVLPTGLFFEWLSILRGVKKQQ